MQCLLRATKISYFETLVNCHENIPGSQIAVQHPQTSQELLYTVAKIGLDWMFSPVLKLHAADEQLGLTYVGVLTIPEAIWYPNVSTSSGVSLVAA